ncbi:MAG: hypothetical protein ACQEWI_01810 [Bacillota bacterium]
MKKLVKHVKKDQGLALSLYESGNFDAMYLTGLSGNPKKIGSLKMIGTCWLNTLSLI